METAKTHSEEQTHLTSGDDKDAVIKIRHLKKAFGRNAVLKDINMDLYKCENVVVLGRSGQGKSVTIKCIAGLMEPDGGSLKVYDKEVKEMNEEELKDLRIKVGFLFQSGALYDSMTVRENLEFPLTRVLKIKDKAKLDELVEEVLDAVGLKDAINKMPASLSGGMRKRIGLARTLIVKPSIMLYDEPTTGLDPITSREISELILQMREKYSTSSIIITHDMACAKIVADRIMVMDEGKFIAEGSYEELENSDNKLVSGFFK